MDGLKLKYFVLNPTSSDSNFARASQVAMRAFAEEIRDDNEQLADDIDRWAERCENGR